VQLIVMNKKITPQNKLHEEPQTRGMSSAIPLSKLPKSLIEKARFLRKNQTEAEEMLWQLVRNKQLNGLKIRRQHPIEEGFILDFYCHEVRLAIEVDGGYHNKKDVYLADQDRTQRLNTMGIRVIRFTNEEVLDNAEMVLEEILRQAGWTSPQPLS